MHGHMNVTTKKLKKGAQIPGDQFFFTVTPNICGPTMWHLLHGTKLASNISRCSLFFGKFAHTCSEL